MLRFVSGFVFAVKFLTILPIDRAGRIQPRSMGSIVFWFPAVGLVLGAGAWSVYAGLAGRFSEPVLACLCLVVYFVFTGAIHLDGLADTLDGAIGGRTRARRLEIMRDSRIGTFGVLGIVAACGLRWGALGSMARPIRPMALVLMPVIGRWAQTLGMTMWHYARRTAGTGALFINESRPSHLVGSTCVMLVIVLAIGRQFLPAVAAAEACGILWALLVASRIGGMTGDTLGSMSELTEISFLVVCSYLAPVGRI